MKKGRSPFFDPITSVSSGEKIVVKEIK
jgi:hypothetical protein